MSSSEHAFHLHRFVSPIGTILLVTDSAGVLRALDFSDYEPRMHRLLLRHYDDHSLIETKIPEQLSALLHRYFEGEVSVLSAIHCATNGTKFQQGIWRALRMIEAGRTQTYGELAAQLGLANAARAVGLANGANPIAIVIPCHRLIGANGQLTGYAGGLGRKQWLLAHEHAFRNISA